MAQKAYNPSRYIHEALINTVETIRDCESKKVAGILVSVDLKKAFDSVFHEFMREVYKFFGFGNYFVRLSETLGNGRSAHVVFDDGNLSKKIPLHRCRPQGDSPSPRQLNMCQQICIFKIELDPEIRSVYLSFLVPRLVPGARIEQEKENLATEEKLAFAEERNLTVSREILSTRKKVSCFADDLNAAVAADLQTMTKLKQVLTNFGMISGLCTNVEKTMMMKIGDQGAALEPGITELGFTLENKIKILGFEVDSKVQNLAANFDKCIAKMRGIVGNWSRYRLSLPGKIAIAKTFLLSQITYVGTILDPDPGQLREMTNIIENFVSSNIVIARDRIYSSPENGGLGMINLSTFLDA